MFTPFSMTFYKNGYIAMMFLSTFQMNHTSKSSTIGNMLLRNLQLVDKMVVFYLVVFEL
jgi:hypothetical protein